MLWLLTNGLLTQIYRDRPSSFERRVSSTSKQRSTKVIMKCYLHETNN